MPNWCNNFINFWSDGTPEGKACLLDLHNKIVQTNELMKQLNPTGCYGDLWEVYLANYGYGVKIDCYQRGYIFYIGDISCDGEEFSIETDDAWSPNIQFWVALLQYFYQNHITFTFQASEPGMGIYETNDPSMLPRYSVDIAANGVDELLQFSGLWDWSNPLFPHITSEYVQNRGGGWIQYPVYSCDGNPPSNFSRYISPSVEFYDSYEGDEDDIVDYLGNLITHKPINSIADVADINGLYINEWQYVDTDEIINSEKVCNSLVSTIAEGKEPLDDKNYGLVQPIYDNFTTFLGGEENA